MSSYNKSVVKAYFREFGIPEPVYEFQFAKELGRRFRFDLCWTSRPNLLALEVQGGLFVHGAHARGAAIAKDHEKRNLACEMGYRILYYQPHELCLKTTAEQIKRCLDYDYGLTKRD
jgi:hypothetical protein